MRNLVIIAGALMSLTLPSSVAAQDFDRGVSAYEAGDYLTALRELRPLAEQGDAVAQNYLGVMYYNGQGVPQNYQLAYMWFSLAAAKGGEGAASARDRAAGRMTREQIARAQQLSAECFNRNYQGCAQ